MAILKKKSHMICLNLRVSQLSQVVSLILHLTPIHWYSKRQTCVETSAYGSEIVAGRITVDLAVEM
eukprot:15365740-Ditylum_brightwellii.AAC.4